MYYIYIYTQCVYIYIYIYIYIYTYIYIYIYIYIYNVRQHAVAAAPRRVGAAPLLLPPGPADNKHHVNSNVITDVLLLIVIVTIGILV